MPFGDDIKGNTVAYAMLAVTLIGSLLAGSMRFQAVETRLSTVEVSAAATTAKLDSISAALARIEGRLAEQDQSRSKR